MHDLDLDPDAAATSGSERPPSADTRITSTRNPANLLKIDRGTKGDARTL